MPNYITATDVRSSLSDDEVAELTDDEVDGLDIINSTFLNDHIDRAESWVDSFLAKRYSVPLVTPSDAVKDAVVVRVKYKLFLRRERFSDELEAEYEDTKEWLISIRDAENELPDIDDETSELEAEVGFASATASNATAKFDNVHFGR